jgi:hypothetical protein
LHALDCKEVCWPDAVLPLVASDLKREAGDLECEARVRLE